MWVIGVKEIVVFYRGEVDFVDIVCCLIVVMW